MPTLFRFFGVPTCDKIFIPEAIHNHKTHTNDYRQPVCSNGPGHIVFVQIQWPTQVSNGLSIRLTLPNFRVKHDGMFEGSGFLKSVDKEVFNGWLENGTMQRSDDSKRHLWQLSPLSITG